MLDESIHDVACFCERFAWDRYERPDGTAWYYAEDELYIIRDKYGAFTFVKAGSPMEAMRKFWKMRSQAVRKEE